MDIEHKRWRYEDLDQEQMEMHRRYHSGQLEREMIAANKAFGHGWGVPSFLSIEEMASFEYEFNSYQQKPRVTTG